jgi:predicted nucleotidyltransferase
MSVANVVTQKSRLLSRRRPRGMADLFRIARVADHNAISRVDVWEALARVDRAPATSGIQVIAYFS